MKTALTIAGSDSSGGAGIQADIKTMTANGVYAMSAITALTAQNTTGVYGILEVTPEFLANQLDCIFTDIRPDAVKTGMVSSSALIEVIAQKLTQYKAKNLVIDPVMGDHGSMYPTYTEGMCQSMKKLVAYADILTPNLTEACILTDTPFHEGHWTMKELDVLARKLAEQGPEKIVITGIPQKAYVSNLIYEKGGDAKLLRTLRIGSERSGTGDVFSSIIAADAVNQVPFEASVRKASRFIKKCILRSIEMGLPKTDGVCFEEYLTTLK